MSRRPLPQSGTNVHPGPNVYGSQNGTPPSTQEYVPDYVAVAYKYLGLARNALDEGKLELAATYAGNTLGSVLEYSIHDPRASASLKEVIGEIFKLDIPRQMLQEALFKESDRFQIILYDLLEVMEMLKERGLVRRKPSGAYIFPTNGIGSPNGSGRY